MSRIDKEIQKVRRSTSRPIAGQSLTNDPESPLPFERAPVYSSVHKAVEHIWVKMIDENTYPNLMQALSDGMPVMSLAEFICRGGAQEGLWNPDLMLLLLEPTAYMLIALAERLDIDLVIYNGEIVDQTNRNQLLSTSEEEKKAKKLMTAMKTNTIPEGIITPKMEQQLEEADLPEDKESLLDPPKSEGIETEIPEQEEQPNQDSLLSPTT